MITYWHNPRCSKSRQGLALLEENGVEITVRKYLEDAPDLAEITAAWEALGKPPVADMMRTGEKVFREEGLSKSDDNDKLLAAMAAHPILIERPLAIKDSRAVIGRPPEALLDLL